MMYLEIRKGFRTPGEARDYIMEMAQCLNEGSKKGRGWALKDKNSKDAPEPEGDKKPQADPGDAKPVEPTNSQPAQAGEGTASTTPEDDEANAPWNKPKN